MTDKKDTRPTFIYRLIDSRNGEVRYVGKTVEKLNRRLIYHKKDKRKGSHRTHWIQFFVTQGLEPIIELVETVPPDGD